MAKTTTSGGVTDIPSKDPHLPPLHRVGNLIVPKCRTILRSTGPDLRVLADLMVKWGFTETRFSTDWVGGQLLHLAGSPFAKGAGTSLPRRVDGAALADG